MEMSNLGLLKQQLHKISAELSALPTDDLSDYKASYSRSRKRDALIREKSRLEMEIEIELSNI